MRHGRRRSIAIVARSAAVLTTMAMMVTAMLPKSASTAVFTAAARPAIRTTAGNFRAAMCRPAFAAGGAAPLRDTDRGCRRGFGGGRTTATTTTSFDVVGGAVDGWRRRSGARIVVAQPFSSRASSDGGGDGDGDGGGDGDSPSSFSTAALSYRGNAGEFLADPDLFPTFESIGVSSPALLRRLKGLYSSTPTTAGGGGRPSAVQAAAFPAIACQSDAVIGAETGSGKTLAYLLPLVNDVLERKRRAHEGKGGRKQEGQSDGAEGKADEWFDDDGGDDNDRILDAGYEYARAVILVPNKELAQQAVRMASAVCGGARRCVVWGLGDGDYGGEDEKDVPEHELVRIAIMPGGLEAPEDFQPFRAAGVGGARKRQPPPDIVVSTPAALAPLAMSPKNVGLFADVQTLIVDEADMLLDGGYVRPLNDVLMGFRRADRLHARYTAAKENGEDDAWFDDIEVTSMKKTQHVFVAATLPDYGLRSVDAFLAKKFPNAVRVSMAGMHNARHRGMQRTEDGVAGAGEGDATGGGGSYGAPTVWRDVDENQERMVQLIDALRRRPGEVGANDDGLPGLRDEKIMVFLNSVNDVDGATNGLRRAGINAVPYHAKIPLSDRSTNLDRFRRYVPPTDGADAVEAGATATSPVLVCTDLASRGLDVPGVSCVVQLQFATNVVAHLHRMGRCGRAENRNGRGVVFYGTNERELVDVVREAEEEQGRMTLEQNVDDDGALWDDNEDQEGGASSTKAAGGTIKKAFSRRRGFTKKRKKERRGAKESSSSSY